MSLPNDLLDAEFAELDALLANTPKPLEALDVAMLDGYLCGVLIQPRLIDEAEWLPGIFDFDGRALPTDVDPAWLDRITTLTRRRHSALQRSLAAQGWFDPVVVDQPEDEAAAPGDQPLSEAEQLQHDTYAALAPASRPLLAWVSGFAHALERYPELGEIDEPGIDTALARLFRHLPAETDEEKEILATLDREHPLKDVDDAVEELVACVADLNDLTQAARYHVDTIRRDQPKVGRNDPCPCGSGRKFKACHGK